MPWLDSTHSLACLLWLDRPAQIHDTSTDLSKVRSDLEQTFLNVSRLEKQRLEQANALANFRMEIKQLEESKRSIETKLEEYKWTEESIRIEVTSRHGRQRERT